MQSEGQQELAQEVAQPELEVAETQVEEQEQEAPVEQEAPPAPQEEAAGAEDVGADDAGAAELEQQRLEEEQKKLAEDEEKQRVKRRKEDVAAVEQAIHELEGLPAPARQMLSDGLPHALPSAAGAGGEEEPMLANFVELVANSMEAELSRLATSTEESGAGQREAEAELLRLESAVIEAMDVAKAASEEVDAKAAVSGEAAEAAKVAKEEHQQAEREHETQLQAWQDVRDSRDKVFEVAQGPLKALVESSFEEEKAKEKAVSSVLEYVSDKVLLAAAAPALAVATDARKPFDVLTVDSVTSVLKDHVEGLEREIAESSAEEAQAKAEVLGAWAIADVARDRLREAETVVKEAKARHAEAELGVEVARETVQGQKRKNSELAIRAVLDEANSAKVRKGLTALRRLAGQADEVAEEKEVPGAADVEMPVASKEAAASPSRRNPLGVATPAATL